MSETRAPFGPDFGVGLYVHWPYCARICPYCDFNVYAAKARDRGPLLDAILADIDEHAQMLGPDWAREGLDSIYLGGGTPSLLDPAELAALIEAARARFGLSPACEITLEANPNDVLSADLPAWRGAGVNRVSIGVQSMNDTALKFLGRDHSAAQGQRAVERALREFDNLSVDLIYALPGQSLPAWQGELEAALALGAPHLSLYELTIAEKTAFAKAVARGDWAPMDEDMQADLYELTQTLTAQFGLPAYEISNHARAPQFQSRHNRIYWDSGDWIGVGPGAHGRLSLSGKRIVTVAAARPDKYIRGPLRSMETLGQTDVAREILAMGMRTHRGISLRRFAELDMPLDRAVLAQFVASGHLVEYSGKIALTPRGQLLADYISARLSP